jgi:hypothetical protein
MSHDERRRRIRRWLAFFVVALVASGLTAFPLELETRLLLDALQRSGTAPPPLVEWIARVHSALADVGVRYPFFAYGTDWLAFAHLMIALAFWGAFKDPVRNIWIVEWGMLCGLAVLPLALVCGAIRGIPFGWRCIDMSFGIFGIVPLWFVRRDIRRLSVAQARAQ